MYHFLSPRNSGYSLYDVGVPPQLGSDRIQSALALLEGVIGNSKESVRGGREGEREPAKLVWTILFLRG